MATTSPSREAIARAALGGLGLGLFLAALFLCFRAISPPPIDCAELSASECALERQALAEIGRYQALMAGGLALGSVAIIVYLRDQARKAAR